MITWDDGSVHFEGAVFYDGERNGRDDSDFYAVVWTGETMRTIEYATTRFGGGGSCRVSWTPENEAAALAWFRGVYRAALVARTQRDSKEVKNGRRVRVIRGRKVPQGTEGFVGNVQRSAFGGSRYGTWKAPLVCDLDATDGTRYRFVAVANLEVVEPSSYEMPAEEIERRVAAADIHTAISWVRGAESPYGYVVL